MFSAFFTIDAHKARAQLPSDERHPVRTSPRRAVLGRQVMEHREKSIDPHREFVVSIPGHRPGAADLPGVAVGLMERLPFPRSVISTRPTPSPKPRRRWRG